MRRQFSVTPELVIQFRFIRSIVKYARTHYKHKYSHKDYILLVYFIEKRLL